MSKRINWIVAIIAQQDGEHCFEYADLEYSILSQPSFEHIKYKIFYWEQRSSVATIKETQYSQRFKANTFLNLKQPFIANIYDPTILTSFLQLVLLPDTAEVEYRYMVILWGHGVALGYLSQSTNDPDDPNHFDYFSLLKSPQFATLPAEKRSEYNKKLAHFSFLRAHLPVEYDPAEFLQKLFAKDGFTLSKDTIDDLTDALRLITSLQLNTILEKALPSGKTVDVLIANSCYTQLFETGYALRRSVKLLVSPETTIPFTGFNYPGLFSLLEATPSVGLPEIAENIRDRFRAKYNAEPFRSIFKVQRPVDFLALPEVSFSANFLEYYQDLLDEVINPLAEKLTDMLNAHQGKLIEKVRNNCQDISWQPVFSMSPYGVIDFLHFLTEFVADRTQAGDKSWEPFLDKLQAAHKRICAAWLQAEDPGLYPPTRKTSAPYGLSIFFPSDGTDDTSAALFLQYNTTSKSVVSPQLDPWINFVWSYHIHISVFILNTPPAIPPLNTKPGPASGNPA